jgi:hypothetical protein
MAKDFGMEFERRFGQKWGPEALLHIAGASEYRIYVHADSLGLLEPRAGDYARDNHVLIEITEDESDHPCFTAEDAIEMKARRTWGVFEILQRDGKPFHWPQIEP